MEKRRTGREAVQNPQKKLYRRAGEKGREVTSGRGAGGISKLVQTALLTERVNKGGQKETLKGGGKKGGRTKRRRCNRKPGQVADFKK